MALVKIRPVTLGGKPAKLYENLIPVGASRGDNTNAARACNQLVQFLLRRFFERRPDLLPPLPGRTGFPIDGKVGGQTVTGIHVFQDHFRKAGTPLFDDSRVSVPLGKFVPGTGNFRTMHALNAFARVVMGDAAFDSLFSNREINREAPELTGELVAEELLLNP